MRVSARKLKANRRNARRSTGPRTFAGAQRSRLNALVHGIFCKCDVLPGESPEALGALTRGLLQRLCPQDPLELIMVQRIISATWRLQRLAAAEQHMHETRRQDLADPMRFRRLAGNAPSPMLAHHTRVTIGLSAQPDIAPGKVLAASITLPDSQFHRLQHYEQRLEYTIHRSLRALRELRARKRRIGRRPKSCPYLDLPEFVAQDESSNTQNEPKAQESEAKSLPGQTLPLASGANGRLQKSAALVRLSGPISCNKTAAGG